ncbi:MAG: hypothetical protein KF909_12905 [Rhodocyclaceae bacterium]|nr:hypothetical protein [Rhodocyclaceae bacterium]MCB1911790.1 hypothetical protein [Rhodocyclaceae bacterium]MCP5241716.1 hypothetical protein [Zoogloeaceae bacterium]MCP5256260.1 hypothetical protein [Zoogloeaceae bacterium]MCW5616787.1 hypothetical protein [Rhodocyclaceae bacterium]
MRVQTDPSQVGRCGCGRREYCDGSHGLSEAEWLAVKASEHEAARKQAESAEHGADDR